MTNSQQLYDTIQAGDYDTSDLLALTATLQAETLTERRVVTVAEVSQYADQHGLTLKLINANYDSNLPVDGHKVVDYAQSLLKAKYHDFSMESPVFLQGLQGLVHFGVFTQADADGLLALSYLTRPRWPELTQTEVQVALWQPRIEAETAAAETAERAAFAARNRVNLRSAGIEPDANGGQA